MTKGHLPLILELGFICPGGDLDISIHNIHEPGVWFTREASAGVTQWARPVCRQPSQSSRVAASASPRPAQAFHPGRRDLVAARGGKVRSFKSKVRSSEILRERGLKARTERGHLPSSAPAALGHKHCRHLRLQSLPTTANRWCCRAGGQIYWRCTWTKCADWQILIFWHFLTHGCFIKFTISTETKIYHVLVKLQALSPKNQCMSISELRFSGRKSFNMTLFVVAEMPKQWLRSDSEYRPQVNPCVSNLDSDSKHCFLGNKSLHRGPWVGVN